MMVLGSMELLWSHTIWYVQLWHGALPLSAASAR